MGRATHFSGLNVAPLAVTDAATNSILATNSGRVHIIPDLTADCTFTLPAAEAGCRIELLYGGAAADAQDWIINTASTSSLFKGGVTHLDTDAGSAGDEVVPVYADATDDDTFTVLTPEAGTMVTLISDGTHWYVNGVVVSASAPTFA